LNQPGTFAGLGELGNALSAVGDDEGKDRADSGGERERDLEQVVQVPGGQLRLGLQPVEVQGMRVSQISTGTTRRRRRTWSATW
jgi:hypothetical protein